MFNFTLGRKIDINYPTNKIILIISAIVTLIGYFITKEFSSALYLGAGSFLTWALAREIDPKHKYSAFLCAALSLVNLFYFDRVQLLILFWILLLLRLVTEISGKDASLLDMVIVFAMGVYLSVLNKSSIYLVPLIFAIAYRIKTKGKSKEALVFMILSAAIFLVENSYFGFISPQDISLSDPLSIFVLVGTFGYLMFIDLIKRDVTLDDKGEELDERKVKYAQLLFGNTIILLFLFGGISFNNLVIYFSVIIGVIVYAIVDRIKNRSVKSKSVKP